MLRRVLCLGKVGRDPGRIKRSELGTNIRSGWTPDQVEEFEERAAIMEYDGELSRDQAEAEAARIVNGYRKQKKSS